MDNGRMRVHVVRGGDVTWVEGESAISVMCHVFSPPSAMFLGVGVVMGVVMLVILTAIVILLIVLLAFR